MRGWVWQVLFDLLPLRVLPALVLGSLVYLMCGLQWTPALFGHFLLVLVLFHMVTALVCIAISTVIRQSTSLANLVAIVTLIFFTLMQGAMINFGTRYTHRGALTHMGAYMPIGVRTNTRSQTHVRTHTRARTQTACHCP
jgi:hypothetical protein